ncbi:MAG: FtsX-like permease family protein, partial [Saprospiraceae bacterium]|nr:FtsX-like permease family protein [Saprospiraceae bacterium]
PYQITGVIEDVPAQSHFTFSYISTIYSNKGYVIDLNYTNNNSWKTYIKVNPNTDMVVFQSKLPAFVQKFTGREDAHEHYQYYTKALTDIHLRSKTLSELSVNGDIKYVYFFGVIAIVILLLACTNYTNLATARSLKRAREVGMRKVLGANRQQIAGQFLGESILLTVISLPVAVGLAHSLLPGLGKLLDRPFDSISIFENFWLLPILAAIAVFTGLVAGSYPAFFMSALLPSKVLKDQMKGRSHSWLRSALIVGQFAASVILITGSILVYQQLQFIQQKEMGYQKEQIILIPLKDRSMDAKLETIKTELLRNSGIQSVSVSSHTPANIQSQTSLLDYEGRKGEEHIDIYQAIIDQNFINLYDLKLVEGENIPDQMPQDSLRRYLINETAAKALGWASPIGKRMRGGVVVGVLKDFHMHDLHQPIAPLMLYGNVNWYSFLSVKINTSELPQTLAHIENTIKQASNYPFEFQFFDEFFNKMYQKETRLGTILGYFTIISLIIAALGLFGIAAYTAENRTKEIGIRKILGATVSSIMLLLSKDFSRLVLIALFIGAPLGYLLMRSWLNDFAYRIQLSWVLFAMTSILAMLVAIMAVSFQAYKAANANPVRALRNE